ncbi:uncharacterized HhH-GPD family protein [Rathayibacter oskolensis]|uniref:Uncharacterized HhH-GPD family protein n=1 Tax=Rathayibacter oskolensis TaxID=1891671 RepID=A0A1X7P963_9MICO|nr:HhH-GPD-type base excision DNA repair protein [Rathayibacter oskolensis]SMH46895.1 uncharacterized HhH-GPD family protein [Rathayibacter oskolensis]
MTADAALHITDDPEADALLTRDPLALLIGMLLDQQVAMETAFSGPLKIEQRLAEAGAAFDAASIASFDEDDFSELCRTPPAIHRYPANMAGRVQVLCRALVDDWGADASAIWTRDEPDGRTVLARLKALPGFGDQKAQIFVALLGKRRGFTGAGWREAAGAYGEEDSFRSVADIVSPESLAKVRATKQAAKAAARESKK